MKQSLQHNISKAQTINLIKQLVVQITDFLEWLLLQQVKRNRQVYF